MKAPRIAMIILAAGESKRAGLVKQNLPWKHTTLLGHTIEQGLASDADKVFVVLGANKTLIEKKIRQYNVSLIFNEDWEQGMGFSLALAMLYIEQNMLKYDAVLIALSDQPTIQYAYYNKLIINYINSNKKIISTRYKNRFGVPVILDKKYFSQLRVLNEDHGARKLISQNPIDQLSLQPETEYPDIDTMEQYKRLYLKHGQ